MILDNRTSWQAMVLPGLSQAGREQNTLVIKANYEYSLEGNLTAIEGDEISLYESYYDDSISSSVEKSFEAAPFKQGFEVLIQGKCFPEPSQKALSVTASLFATQSDLVKPLWKKSAHLFGERTVEGMLFGQIASDSEELGELELKWENSYGGQLSDTNKRYDDNPVGVGWKSRKTESKRYPQIVNEGVSASLQDIESPVGFAPIASHWAPRMALFQTFSENLNEMEPGTNIAIPERLYNCAPEDQQLSYSPTFPCVLKLEGWYCAAPNLAITLDEPAMEVWLLQQFKGPKKLQMKLDTLIVNTTHRQVSLLYRLGIDKTSVVETDTLVIK